MVLFGFLILAFALGTYGNLVKRKKNIYKRIPKKYEVISIGFLALGLIYLSYLYAHETITYSLALVATCFYGTGIYSQGISEDGIYMNLGFSNLFFRPVSYNEIKELSIRNIREERFDLIIITKYAMVVKQTYSLEDKAEIKRFLQEKSIPISEEN